MVINSVWLDPGDNQKKVVFPTGNLNGSAPMPYELKQGHNGVWYLEWDQVVGAARQYGFTRIRAGVGLATGQKRFSKKIDLSSWLK